MTTPVILQNAAGQNVVALPAGGGDGRSGEHHRAATSADLVAYKLVGAIRTTAQHADDRRDGKA